MLKVNELSDIYLQSFCPFNIAVKNETALTSLQLSEHGREHYHNFWLARDLKNFSLVHGISSRALASLLAEDKGTASKQLKKLIDHINPGFLKYKEIEAYALIIELFGTEVHTYLTSAQTVYTMGNTANYQYEEEDGSSYSLDGDTLLTQEKLRRLALYPQSYAESTANWASKIQAFCTNADCVVEEGLDSKKSWRTYALKFNSGHVLGASRWQTFFTLSIHPTDANKIRLVSEPLCNLNSVSLMKSLDMFKELEDKLALHFELY